MARLKDLNELTCVAADPDGGPSDGYAYTSCRAEQGTMATRHTQVTGHDPHIPYNTAQLASVAVLPGRIPSCCARGESAVSWLHPTHAMVLLIVVSPETWVRADDESGMLQLVACGRHMVCCRKPPLRLNSRCSAALRQVPSPYRTGQVNRKGRLSSQYVRNMITTNCFFSVCNL